MSETPQTTHAHDFDFYVGTWAIHNRRLRKPLAGCTDWYEFGATSQAQRSSPERATSTSSRRRAKASPG